MNVGMLVYPNLQQLDLTAPYEIFHRLPNATVHLVWKSTDVIRSDSGLGLVPTTTFAACPALDLLFVPGGWGQVAVMDDENVMQWVRDQGDRAKWVTSVCTGSLVLGAAGLLHGYEATSHWAYRALLPIFGAKPKDGRVVIDRNRITAGGVTAGLDFGLTLLAHLSDESRAKSVQLDLEYDPAPPFNSGHPNVAAPELVLAAQEQMAKRFAERQAQIERITAARAH